MNTMPDDSTLDMEMQEEYTVYTIPDTLVLKLIEYDIDTFSPDTMLYLIYDNKYKRYIIRGCRNATKSIPEPLEYSFYCNDEHSLANFIEFICDYQNHISYILYNYTNLPNDATDITYNLLESNRNVKNEIAGYDRNQMVRSQLIPILRMIKNIYNNY